MEIWLAPPTIKNIRPLLSEVSPNKNLLLPVFLKGTILIKILLNHNRDTLRQ
jgi:hypothetical protein